MNKINEKNNSNSKLLHMLMKREQNQFLAIKKSLWPGERRPSFTASIKIKHNSLHTERDDTRKSDRSTLRKTQGQFGRKSSKSLCPLSTVSLKLRTTQKATNPVSFIQQRLKRSSSQPKRIISKRMLSKNAQNDADDYVIDYMAFGYIDKVIDSPQLWTKFVHKKLNI